MEPTEPIGRISDGSGDPAPTKVGFDRRSTTRPAQWTDGFFDLRISVLINGRNGAGTVLNKVVSARGLDLYDIQYNVSGYNYSYAGVTPKMFHVNIPLVTWDLENYGAAWKFSVSEYDPSESVTITNTNTTTFAGNFEFSPSFGDKVKVGAKFGLSATTTNTSTHTVVTTTGSDDLGEAVLDFSHPIILNEFSTTDPRNGAIKEYYNTYEISTGSVRLAVEPRPIN